MSPHTAPIDGIRQEEISGVLWELLIQFIFRLSLGLATAMALTSPREVDAGFFRVHLWVLLGLGTFGSLVAYSSQALFPYAQVLVTLAIVSSVLSYVGSVIWLYDRPRLGTGMLWLLMAVYFCLLLVSHPAKPLTSPVAWIWLALDIASGSLLLGATFAAMLLGHWYLNTPTMKLDPLRRLLLLLAWALVARATLAAIGLLWHWQQGDVSTAFEWAGLAMRWFAGVAGLAGMAWMTWQTLKIPNTQSATGILYVALVFVFLGELASAMLCYRMAVPL